MLSDEVHDIYRAYTAICWGSLHLHFTVLSDEVQYIYIAYDAIYWDSTHTCLAGNKISTKVLCVIGKKKFIFIFVKLWSANVKLTRRIYKTRPHQIWTVGQLDQHQTQYGHDDDVLTLRQWRNIMPTSTVRRLQLAAVELYDICVYFYFYIFYFILLSDIWHIHTKLHNIKQTIFW